MATADPMMGEDIERVMTSLSNQVRIALQKKRKTVFNSAELFLSLHHKELHLSNGLQHRSSQSRIYVESAFSFSQEASTGQILSDEFLTSKWAVHLDHLSIEDLFQNASDCAENSLDVTKPTTGKYAVMIDADVLAPLLQGHISQLGASHAYNGLPFIKPGDDFIPDGRRSEGDLLSITLDPSLDYGAATTSVSSQGLPQKPLVLVDRNQVVSTSTDKQYADYMGIASTTVNGNLGVLPGSYTHEELTRQAPVVIEILQFSGLFTDPNSGTFGSEIRLAKIYDNVLGKTSYLKGGSLSGSIAENFQGLKLSKTRVNRAYFTSESSLGQGYYGPEYALLNHVSIVG